MIFKISFSYKAHFNDKGRKNRKYLLVINNIGINNQNTGAKEKSGIIHTHKRNK